MKFSDFALNKHEHKRRQNPTAAMSRCRPGFGLVSVLVLCSRPSRSAFAEKGRPMTDKELLERNLKWIHNKFPLSAEQIAKNRKMFPEHREFRDCREIPPEELPQEAAIDGSGSQRDRRDREKAKLIVVRAARAVVKAWNTAPDSDVFYALKTKWHHALYTYIGQYSRPKTDASSGGLRALARSRSLLSLIAKTDPHKHHVFENTFDQLRDSLTLRTVKGFNEILPRLWSDISMREDLTEMHAYYEKKLKLTHQRFGYYCPVSAMRCILWQFHPDHPEWQKTPKEYEWTQERAWTSFYFAVFYTCDLEKIQIINGWNHAIEKAFTKTIDDFIRTDYGSDTFVSCT